jgi:hypothetical protein
LPQLCELAVKKNFLGNPFFCILSAFFKVQFISTENSSFSGSVDGVVSIILKDESEIERVIPSYTSNMNFTVYDEPRIFYSPKHHTTLQSDYKPDLRITLPWEPNIKVENNNEVVVNYFNADNSSKIKVNVEGITSSGIRVTAKTEYEVK